MEFLLQSRATVEPLHVIAAVLCTQSQITAKPLPVIGNFIVDVLLTQSQVTAKPLPVIGYFIVDLLFTVSVHNLK